MQIERFSEKQIQILKYLGIFKFLTYSQMIRLDIDQHKSNLSSTIKGLATGREQFVRKIPHQPGSETKFYLTPKGKKVLVELLEFEEEKISIPKGIITTDTQDQKHRTTIISLQIELYLTCQINALDLLLCDRYFDKVGNNRINKNLKSKTAFIYEGNRSVKADMVFMLQTNRQKELYILELENGKDTKKAIQKCINHGKAILLGSANEKYEFMSGYRTLWVFEHESIMLSTINALDMEPFFEHMKEYFLFTALDKKMESSFFDDWVNISKKERQLFYVK
ncbi:MAG: hypothetical protein AAFO07_14695 [Bacteroidota bacterium]